MGLKDETENGLMDEHILLVRSVNMSIPNAYRCVDRILLLVRILKCS